MEQNLKCICNQNNTLCKVYAYSRININMVDWVLSKVKVTGEEIKNTKHVWSF